MLAWLEETEIWFAWYPVRLTSGRWLWWQVVQRERDVIGPNWKGSVPGSWRYKTMAQS